MMQITLRAKSAYTGDFLFAIAVSGDGRWRYESRVIEGAHGRLSDADRAQLKALYDKVDWGKEVLNGPLSRDAHVHFELEVTHDGGDQRLYQFDDDMHNRSWQFRDLVHFLRHNVATAGAPVGEPAEFAAPSGPEEHPPLPM